MPIGVLRCCRSFNRCNVAEHKVLDAWRPPEGAGEALGCVTTTYTFDPELFQHHCLPRFMSLESDPDHHEVVFVLEFEESMAQLAGAVVLVDGAHVPRVPRSMRWDVLPVQDAVMHAKVSLLVWSNHVRVLVGSNNLSESGYRRQREHFTVLDFSAEGFHAELFHDVLQWLREQLMGAPKGHPGRIRGLEVLATAEQCAEGWDPVDLPPGIRARWMFTGPGRASLAEQSSQIWPASTSLKAVNVVSPFYVGAEDANGPLEQLLNLGQGGDAVWRFYGRGLHTEEESSFEGPKSLRTQAKAVGISKPQFYAVHSESEEGQRPLHAKVLLLEFEDRMWGIHGSSNFTNRGWGLVPSSNHEANLWLEVGSDAQWAWERMIKDWRPKGDHVHSLGSSPEFQKAGEDDVDAGAEGVEGLPLMFGAAIWHGSAEKGQLLVHLDRHQKVASSWRLVQSIEDNRTLLDSVTWSHMQEPEFVQLDGVYSLVSVIYVELEEDLVVPWPVSMHDLSQLPSSDVLVNLGLEELIDLLSHSGSFHRLLVRHMRRQQESVQQQPEVVDAHSKVDVSGFLLRRTRRFSYALSALSKQLSQPCFTKNQFRWRCEGPVGVMAVARAIGAEVHSHEEQAFFLAELALEIADIEPQQINGSLPAAEVKSMLSKAIQELIAQCPKGIQTEMGDYVRRSFRKAMGDVQH